MGVVLKKNRWFLGGAAAILVLLLLAEVGLRWAGVINFPVYSTDDQIGYIAAPQQSGAFLRKNRWELNAQSMGTGAWAPNGDKDVLLLGDSLVWGGNPLDQPQKLGPQLESQLAGWRVWPASAGSWAVLNEITYLHRHPDVVAQADQLVWILNTGDFGNRTQWSSESTHPKTIPVSALGYVVQKYVVPRIFASGPKEVEAVPPSIHLDSVNAFKDELQKLHGRKILVVLYPDRKELAAESPLYVDFKKAMVGAMGDCCQLVELRSQPGWNASLYRDEIHPTAEGNQVLAGILRKGMGL